MNRRAAHADAARLAPPATVPWNRGAARAICWAFGLAMAATALGADDNQVFTPGATRAESPVSSAGASFTSMSLVLGVGLAAAGGWMVWRNRRGPQLGREHRSLLVDETRSLGNRQFLVVASYEGKKFLLGVCPGRIDLLAPLDDSGVNHKARE